MSLNFLSPNSTPERIADARFLVALGELRDHIARVEARFADVKAKLAIFDAEDSPHACCDTDCPENCGDMTCPDARHYDHLERLNRQILADADPFGIGPVAGLSEAIVYPPPPHVAVRRAARMLADVDRTISLSYAAHARTCARLDGGAA